jgi:hypothetical protein
MQTWKGPYISVLISKTSKNKKLAQTKVDSTLSKIVLRYQQKLCLNEKEKIPKSMATWTKLLIELNEFGISIGYMCDACVSINFAMTCIQVFIPFKYKTHITKKKV